MMHPALVRGGRKLPRQNPRKIFHAPVSGSTDVTISGPFFDGRADLAVGDMLDEMVEVVASQALADVHFNLNDSIQFPTPYYETQIIKESINGDQIVHDRGIVYGPWLEGTGSRNRTTRFKGYWSFRRAAAGLRGKIGRLTAPIVERYVRRMS
jgi:hypothetical protein